VPAIDELIERLSEEVDPAEIVELSRISTEELVELLRSHLVSNATEIVDYLED